MQNQKMLMGLVLGVVILGGGFLIFGQLGSDGNSTSHQETSMVKTNSMTASDTDQGKSETVMVQGMAEEGQVAAGNYQDYSAGALAAVVAEGKKPVLFFHANWCPSCRQADKDIKDNLSALPEDVVVLKTDYDTQSELKKKYGITYQHTFVQVDAEGELVTKWNGGGATTIAQRVK